MPTRKNKQKPKPLKKEKPKPLKKEKPKPKKPKGKTRSKQYKKNAKGKSVTKNRQLKELLSNFIPDDVISKIDKILKDELEYQRKNKKEILENLKPIKKIMNNLLYEYPGNEEFQNILDAIANIEKLPIENFDKDKIKNMEKEIEEIKKEAIELIEIGIENEQIAQSEITNYNSTSLDKLEEMLNQLSTH